MRVRVKETVAVEGLVWEPGVYVLEEGYWLLRLLATGACERVPDEDDEGDGDGESRPGGKRVRKERE